jgi:hypothetical protein
MFCLVSGGKRKLNDVSGRHESTSEQAGWDRGIVTATGTICVAIAAAARVPALTTLATAATARKRRRVGSTGIDMLFLESA